MTSNYQPWYDVFVEDSEQNVGFGDSGIAPSREADGSYHPPLQTTYDGTGLSANMLWGLRLPPSIRSAAERPQPEPSYLLGERDECLAAAVPASDEHIREIATAPFSFSQRSLQYQHYIETLLGDQFLGIPSYQKRDSGVGGLEGLLDFAGSVNMADDSSNNLRASQNEDCSCQPTPLQYHLIESRALMARQGEAASNPSPPNVPSLTMPSSSGDAQPFSCPLCTDKRYTGVWAHRNLTRHMERAHAPCSSAGGIRHFPCSHGDCERTFRREDARLVHERRSHPELNRAPPARRRRSGELRP